MLKEANLNGVIFIPEGVSLYQLNMKIKVILVAFCILAGLIITSCKAQKSCPAYGDNSVEQHDKAVS
jgi:hypothetical protein